jgi:lipopolysaccharide export system permease protein
MKLIDRYLFLQLLGPTLAALAALCGLALLSQALGGFELIVEQRQSAVVFLRVVALATPQLVVTILPIALLVATLVTFNRLHKEQEIVVCFAGGMSRWRVISPAMRIAALGRAVALRSTSSSSPRRTARCATPVPHPHRPRRHHDPGGRVRPPAPG